MRGINMRIPLSVLRTVSSNFLHSVGKSPGTRSEDCNCWGTPSKFYRCIRRISLHLFQQVPTDAL